MNTAPLNLFPLTTRVSMKLATGIDEKWLQEQIFMTPRCLGLGDLMVLGKEVIQPSGGRLDLLLADEEEESVYEVEIMLGETDPSHILRSIEYWDVEKRRRPSSQHYAVLVAEYFDRRFFNVLYLLSETIPLIAIQAQLLEFDDRRVLNFTKVLDVYQESLAAEDAPQPMTRDQWIKRNQACVSSADALLQVLLPVLENPRLNYTLNYINIMAGGYGDFWLVPKKTGKTRLNVNIPNHRRESMRPLLEQYGGECNEFRKGFEFRVDATLIERHSTLFQDLARVIKRAS